MKIEPRRPYDENRDGYLESDRDYFENNAVAAVQLLDLYSMNLAAPAQGKKVGPWVPCEHSVMRVIVGGDPDNVADRVAFIEKTPRVRIHPSPLAYSDTDFTDYLNWLSGLKGDGAHDPHSRAWCDRMLIALGYDLEDY